MKDFRLSAVIILVVVVSVWVYSLWPSPKEDLIPVSPFSSPLVLPVATVTSYPTPLPTFVIQSFVISSPVTPVLADIPDFDISEAIEGEVRPVSVSRADFPVLAPGGE